MKNEISRLFKKMLTVISPELNAKVIYWVKFRKKLNLAHPKDFHEKLVALKIKRYNYDPLVKQCADKYAVRNYVISKNCGDVLNELIAVYDTPDQLEWESLPAQFVIKWNFGCGYNIISQDKSKLNRDAVIKQLKKWQKSTDYLDYAELQYKDVKKVILVEKFLFTHDMSLPADYKLYCFNGNVKAILYIADRDTHEKKAAFFSPEWRYLGKPKKSMYSDFSVIPTKPKSLVRMCEVAETLSQGFPFVRVDFYDVDGRAVFGEMTFTPAGGNDASEINIDGVSMGELLTI